MTKILLVGDIHAADRPPSSVNEGYLDDIITMLNWLADYQNDNGYDATIWAGDIFNHKQPGRTSHSTVLRMIEVVQRYNGKLWIVIGNHDISNDVLASVHEKQPLGILLAAGAHELDGWHDGGLPVFGVPWQQRWLHEDTPMEALTGWREDLPRFGEKNLSKSLVVTHAPIYPPKEAQSVMFELVPTSGPHGLGEAMQHTGSLYYGHIHEDHGIWEDDGVIYANMGAISRGSLHEYNLNREIKAASWSPEDGFIEIPIPHKPAAAVFKLAEAAEAKADKLSLDTFLLEIGNSTLDISSTEAVIEHIRSMEIPENVKVTAIQILEEV